VGTDPVRVGAAIGRVVGLWRYPVKAMAAEAAGEAEVSWHGLAGDRRWGFVREGRERGGFPWLTIRDLPAMARYRPRLADPARPDRSPVLVTTPSGAELDVADPALAAELGAELAADLVADLGEQSPVRALKLDRGTFDALPLSLVTTQSLATLGTWAGRPLAVGRFRPNVLVEAEGDGFPEEAWVGCTLRVGGALVRVDRRDKRCVVVNVDPATAERDPIVLRTIARQRKAHFGVYGSTARPGRVAVGDAVVVHELTDAHVAAT
jgi:MOSC domain-containing protein